MAGDANDFSPMFRIDVNQNASEPTMIGNHDMNYGLELTALMQQLVIGQDRSNELLEELVDQIGAGQRQRANELGQWKDANPILARKCRVAAEALSKVQTEFLEMLTYEVRDNFDHMLEGDFVLNEFVDKYGPRLAHLNGVLQLLSQLSSIPQHANSQA